MNYIVGDIGNTTTRICLLDNRFSIIKTSLFDTNKIYKNYTKKNN